MLVFWASITLQDRYGWSPWVTFPIGALCVWAGLFQLGKLTGGTPESRARKLRETIQAKIAAGESLKSLKLREADLRGANLSNAYLEGADLSFTKLSEAKLFGAMYSTDTIWPEGFDPVAAGAVLVEDDD